MASIPGAAGPGAPFPQWFYNTLTHTVSEVTSPATKGIAESVSFPAKLIFFTSQKAADDYLKSQGGGADISKSPITKVANTATDTATAAPTGLAAIGNFFGDLSQANTWIRVAKVLIGGTLLIVGLAKLTGVDKQVAVLGKAVAKTPLL